MGKNYEDWQYLCLAKVLENRQSECKIVNCLRRQLDNIYWNLTLSHYLIHNFYSGGILQNTATAYMAKSVTVIIMALCHRKNLENDINV